MTFWFNIIEMMFTTQKIKKNFFPNVLTLAFEAYMEREYKLIMEYSCVLFRG